MSLENKDELRELIQEEIHKAFTAAINAAVNGPKTRMSSTAFPTQNQEGSIDLEMVGKNVMSALNHLKADAQARVVEEADPERAKRIRALADPEF